jgi:glycosyltransferase involved in cell wall biosynthesis
VKIHPAEKNLDLCQTSIDLLREATRAWLSRRGIGAPVVFADHHDPYPIDASTSQAEMVLFGGFLRRFFESGNWTAQSYRFWVPAATTREILCRQLGIPAKCIGLIPRYELFSAMAPARPLPHPSDVWNFVYAGRLSPTKNIRTLLHFVSQLQTLGLNCDLHLMGDFDCLTHPDRGRFESLDYEAEIHSLSKRLSWTSPPVFHPKTGHDLWFRTKLRDPVFLSLSTFLCEDYGVAVAQAQAQGWPCVISDWGGHRDVQGKGVVKIAPQMIGHDHEPEDLIALRARQLAIWFKSVLEVKSLADSSEESARTSHQIASDSSLPALPTAPALEVCALSLEDLDRIRRKAIASIGPEATLIDRMGLAPFADTPPGSKFFENYRRLMAEEPHGQNGRVILVNDFSEATRAITGDIGSVAFSMQDAAARAGENVYFVPIRELRSPEFAHVLMNASKVVLPFFSKEALPLISFLTRESSLAASVSVVLSHSKSSLQHDDQVATENLKAMLRPQDEILFSDSKGVMS